MKQKQIYYCKECGALDYATGVCPKCGSRHIVPTEDFTTGYVMNIQFAQPMYFDHVTIKK